LRSDQQDAVEARSGNDVAGDCGVRTVLDCDPVLGCCGLNRVADDCGVVARVIDDNAIGISPGNRIGSDEGVNRAVEKNSVGVRPGVLNSISGDVRAGAGVDLDCRVSSDGCNDGGSHKGDIRTFLDKDAVELRVGNDNTVYNGVRDASDEEAVSGDSGDGVDGQIADDDIRCCAPRSVTGIDSPLASCYVDAFESDVASGNMNAHDRSRG
jgi:hypothetical protein